jgi:serine/threonine protein kinase
MPAADRNLLVILAQESPTFVEVRTMLFQVARCLEHMHSQGKLHGDVKPLNIVRMVGGGFKLIDFDATVNLGDAAGAKLSTAYVPPELLTTTPDGRASARDPKLGGCKAHPTFDIWSLAVVAFLALTGEQLFKRNNADNCTGKGLDRIRLWSARDLEAELGKLRRGLEAGVIQYEGRSDGDGTAIPLPDILAAVELLAWMLQPKAPSRPQSFAEVLGHSYFNEVVPGTFGKVRFRCTMEDPLS